MHETLGERLTEKLYGGANWEIKYFKSEVNNAGFYIRRDKKMIEATKKKYPVSWKKRIGGWKRDIEFFEKQKKESKNKIRRWEAIKNAERKMRKVI